MPDLVEQMYCSQQIFIPPNLPSILKKYAKAAIRTQPGDLLAWSSAYFRALAEGIPPPAKDRIEYPPIDTPSGLSPGFLKVLVNQIGKRETIHKDVLAERWKGVCLNPKALQDLLDVGMFEDDVSWLEFLAICVGTLEPSLTRTMIELCELLTDEPEGGRAAIPVTIFLNLYKYLAKLDCGPENRLEEYEKALRTDSETQCQASDLKPTEVDATSQQNNIDWDKALGGASDVGDADEAIVVEAADVENESEERDDGNGGQESVTEKMSPEVKEEESEEDSEVKEEEVKVIEVMNDSQPANASEDVEMEKSVVAQEGAEIEEADMQENEVKGGESAPPTAADNEMAEASDEVDGIVVEGGDMLAGESSVGDEEKTDEVSNGNGVEGGEEVEEAAALDSVDAVDQEAVKEEGEAGGDGSVAADVIQGKETSDETADGEEENDENKSNDQAAENEATETPAGEDEKADEGVVENESNEPDVVDDTRDEKVGSEAIPVESAESPGEGVNEDAEENVGPEDGIETQTVLEIEQSAPDEQESAEKVNETSPSADDVVQENPMDDSNGGESNDKNEGEDVVQNKESEEDLDNAASADQAEDAVPTEEADDPSSNQGETEDLAAQEDLDNSASADQVEDAASAEEAADPSSNQGETEELAAQEDLDIAASSDQGSQDQAEDEAPKEQADDPSSTQGETEELAAQEGDANAPSADDASQDQVEDSPQNDTDNPLSVQTESEQPVADEVEDQDGSTGADDQDAANLSKEESKEETGEDESGLENINSAEIAAAEDVEQKAEDGNDIQLLSVEEIIDPKSAYIVNDDGTLSAPRAESAVGGDALKERDSDNSVYTKESDGMMVWPDIRPEDKEEAEPEPLLEKEVTSEDGIEVFTDIEAQAHQEELKLLPEQQEEEPVEAEQEENIFAPQIDSFTELLEVESAHVEEANPEQLAAALESMELAAEELDAVVTSGILAPESIYSEEGVSQGQAETGTESAAETKVDEEEQTKDKKPRRKRKDVEIESLVKKDSDMMLLPTPITSDVMLYIDGACDKVGVKSQTQQLAHKMSMMDVQVFVPVDETIVEVIQEHRYPKWMHVPGIGPTVPDHIVEEAEKYFLSIAELQEGMVMPRNIRHFHCPPLELLPDCPEGIGDGF